MRSLETLNTMARCRDPWRPCILNDSAFLFYDLSFSCYYSVVRSSKRKNLHINPRLLVCTKGTELKLEKSKWLEYLLFQNSYSYIGKFPEIS